MIKVISRTFLFTALLVMAFASCKKEDDPPPSNTTPAPSPYASDSIKLGTVRSTFTARTNNVVSSQWRASGTYHANGYNIFIYTGAAAIPTSNITFQVIPPVTPSVVPPLNANQAYIYIMNSATYESFQGGSMVCTVSGGVVHLQITGMTVSTTSVSTQFPLSMYLTLP